VQHQQCREDNNIKDTPYQLLGLILVIAVVHNFAQIKKDGKKVFNRRSYNTIDKGL